MEEIKETGCCPRFKPEPWDKKEHVWTDRLFVKTHNPAIFHIPFNMGKMMRRVVPLIEQNGAMQDPQDFVMLSYDPTPWRSEHLIGVSKEIPGLENRKLSGTFMTKVYEGPYSQARIWCKDMEEHVRAGNKRMKKLYFYYTTCPKCAKVYGKNYVVGVAEVED